MKPISNFFVLLFLSMFSSQCAYRFSNEALKTPYGLYKLAIEAVYDSSGRVLPHHLLWLELHRAYASFGRMRIVSLDEADFVLRPQIIFAIEQPSNVVVSGLEKDLLEGEEIYQTKEPVGRQFKNLMKSGSFAQRTSMGFDVRVDGWNLHTGKRIFQATYSTGAQFPSMRDTGNSVLFTAQFLAHEESFQSYFRQMARGIAQRIVGGFQPQL